MANRIKGITVEIGGDTTGLDKALTDVNKNLRTTQSDLTDINRLLKLDPKNVTLLAQKQKALTSAVSDTEKKLQTLRTASDQAHDALERGAMTANQFDALQREIIQTEQNLQSLQAQARETANRLDSFRSSASELSTSASNLSDKTRGLTTGIAAIGGAALATIPATEEFRESMSKLEANVMEAGANLDRTKDAFRQFYGVVGDTDSSIEALSNLLQTGFDDNELAYAVDALSGAVVRFPDTLSIESLADSLQETIATGTATGQFAELLDRLGIGAEGVSNAMATMSSEAERQNFAMQLLARTGLTESYEAWAKENEAMLQSRDSQIALQEQMAILAESLLPVVTAVTELAVGFLNWFNTLNDGGKTAVVVLAGLIASISPIAALVANITQVMATANITFALTHGKIILIVGAIAALVMMIAGLAQAWDSMSGVERVIAILGLLTAAAFTAAVAVGAFQSAATLGIAALAIAAGIGAVMIAVGSAQSRAQQMEQQMRQVPKLAKGAVIAPNKPFLAMLGDQSSGTNIEAPLSTIKQAVSETVGAQGGTGGGTVYATMEVDGVTFARLMAPYMGRENTRRGVSLVV